jgi:hypothetical protein
MTEDLTPEGRLAWLKIQGRASCLNCAYLYCQDTGYSNYTVEDTEARCALDMNPQLPAPRPWDWNNNPQDDNWPKTKNGMCWRILEWDGAHAHFDVDGEEGIEQFGLPSEAIEAIMGHR